MELLHFDEWPSTTLFITFQRTECESAIKDYNNPGTSTAMCDWGKVGWEQGLQKLTDEKIHCLIFLLKRKDRVE